MSPGPSKKSLILIVEDDASIRDFLRNALTTAGFQISEAITGEEALDRASESHPI